MGQVHNVFLIVVLTAIMAIVTAVITFFVDMVTPALTSNVHAGAADALVILTRTSRGH